MHQLWLTKYQKSIHDSSSRLRIWGYENRQGDYRITTNEFSIFILAIKKLYSHIRKLMHHDVGDGDSCENRIRNGIFPPLRLCSVEWWWQTSCQVGGISRSSLSLQAIQCFSVYRTNYCYFHQSDCTRKLLTTHETGCEFFVQSWCWLVAIMTYCVCFILLTSVRPKVQAAVVIMILDSNHFLRSIVTGSLMWSGVLNSGHDCRLSL